MYRYMICRLAWMEWSYPNYAYQPTHTVISECKHIVNDSMYLWQGVYIQQSKMAQKQTCCVENLLNPIVGHEENTHTCLDSLRRLLCSVWVRKNNPCSRLLYLSIQVLCNFNLHHNMYLTVLYMLIACNLLLSKSTELLVQVGKWIVQYFSKYRNGILPTVM